jgi:4'-phosphopantetheinyl transferase
VWLTEPEAVTDPSLLEAYTRLLSPEEREQWQRFHFERHRRQYLVSHALVRLTLSRYAPLAPEAWTFVTNPYGRPEVDGAHNTRLRFNLSHTDGLVLCAVTLDADLGVDVEDTARGGQPLELAPRVFAPSELAALHALPAPLQRERFFAYWTLKEAYIKARGLGLALPLQQFAFHLAPGEPPRISFDPCLADAPEAWRFFQFQPSPRHLAALAVRQPSERPCSVRCWRTIPLKSDAVEPSSL